MANAIRFMTLSAIAVALVGAAPGASASPQGPVRQAVEPGGGGGDTEGESSDEEGSRTFNFEEDQIRTDFLQPNTMMVQGMQRGRTSSLIDVRMHFIDAIVRSAEDL